MANFSSVNAGALISAIKSCSNGLSNVGAKSLLADGKSLSWDGSGAKDNMVAALESIKSQTNSLTSALQGLLGIANAIKAYKVAYNNYKTLQARCSSARTRYKNADASNPSYGYLQSIYHQSKNAKDKAKQQVEKLDKKLTGMGYPPSSY